MNHGLAALQSYPFERLAGLLDGVVPPSGRTVHDLTIGEPRHGVPALIRGALAEHLDGLARYPASAGEPALREAIAAWARRRFGLPAGALSAARHVLPVAGTREGLFSFAQCVVAPGPAARVAMPNPGYQVYEGATLLAGATPLYLPLDDTGRPDLDAVPATTWAQVQLLYLCSPGNPSGAVFDLTHYQAALELAQRHGFVIAADECYSELYLDEAAPPLGLLDACQRLGLTDFANCVVFHSLSKRSSAPGLRSGFVAGDARLIAAFRAYRTYHGVTLPPPTQAASIAAWSDEAHVADNRARYREKYAAVLPILAPVVPVPMPAAAFYLWPPVPGDDEIFARDLYRTQGVKVLPGSYLGRTIDGANPGAGRVRIALVADTAACADAARRVRDFLAA